LGAAQVLRAGDEEPETLKGVEAALLVRLALTSDTRVNEAALRGEVWGDEPVADNTIEKAVSRLRIDHRLGLPALPTKDDVGYVLVSAELAGIDSEVFVRGVEALGAAPDRSAVGPLLAMWRGDPRHIYRKRVPDILWRPVYRARDRLLQAVRRLPDGDIADFPELDQFLRAFPTGDCALADLRSRAAVPADAPRRRLLIVDDKIARDLALILRDYDSAEVTSLSDWWGLVERGDLRFDLALVDLHLEHDMTDETGRIVLEYLAKHLDIPTILISARPPDGLWDDFRTSYPLRTLKLFYKPSKKSLPSLRHVVASLIAEAESAREER
jgi:hypothetical protein